MKHALSLILALITSVCAAVEVGPYKVTKVVDGDTIRIQTDLGEQSIRILYVDTPESADNSHCKKMPEESGGQRPSWLSARLSARYMRL